jgi:hypothetical protein
MVEREQCLFGKGRNKLNGEKWIPRSLLMRQLREWSNALRRAVKGIRE